MYHIEKYNFGIDYVKRSFKNKKIIEYKNLIDCFTLNNFKIISTTKL